MKFNRNLGFLAFSTLLLISCGSEELKNEAKPETLHSTDNLESTLKADKTGDTLRYGTEQEGIDKKDLEKKSADYEPDEVKFKH